MVSNRAMEVFCAVPAIRKSGNRCWQMRKPVLY